MSAPFPMDPREPIHIAGHRGLVGGAAWRHLLSRGHTNLLGRSSAELDLTDRAAVFRFYEQHRPTFVLLAAARVGGIMANSTHPVEFLSENLRIQLNVLDAAHHVGVRRLLFLGSSCIYPKFAEQPIAEESLLTGELERTNDAYAIAKIAGIVHMQALRREYGCSFISAMPTNLYGPGDDFDPSTAHVLPALLCRLSEAARTRAPAITLWGTGTPRREFLHVDDLARACVVLLEHYDSDRPINIGVGTDVSISALATTVAEVVGYRGRIDWDSDKPDGTPRKLLDVRRITALGWEPRIGLREGIEHTWRWLCDTTDTWREAVSQ